MRFRSSLARAVMATLAALLMAVLVAPSAACQQHRCDPPPEENITLQRVDDDTYESSSIDGQWVNFPGAQGLVLRFPPQAEGRKVVSIENYVSVAADQRAEGANFTIAAGDLTIVTYAGAKEGFVKVVNRTCAQYYFRGVVRLGGPLPSSDAGAD